VPGLLPCRARFCFGIPHGIRAFFLVKLRIRPAGFAGCALNPGHESPGKSRLLIAAATPPCHQHRQRQVAAEPERQQPGSGDGAYHAHVQGIPIRSALSAAPAFGAAGRASRRQPPLRPPCASHRRRSIATRTWCKRVQDLRCNAFIAQATGVAISFYRPLFSWAR
jgi:hypothetical protein